MSYLEEEEWVVEHQHHQDLRPKYQPSSYTQLNHAVEFLFLMLHSFILVRNFSFFHKNFASLFVYSAVCTGLLIVLSYVTGFRWDRQWMLVNPQGRMYTQRVEPKLALVEVELPPEAFLENWEPTQDSYMGRLHFPKPYHDK